MLISLYKGEKKMMSYLISGDNALRENNLFSSFVDDVFMGENAPGVDIMEDENKYSIIMDIALYGKENVSVEVEKHVLTISSSQKKETEKKDDDKSYISREIERHSFSRSFRLSEDVDEEKISAEAKDGILTVNIPKVEKAKRGKVEIEVK